MVALTARFYVRALAALAAAWLLVMLATMGRLSAGGPAIGALVGRLDAAVAELDALRRQNDQLRGLLVDFAEISSNTGQDKKGSVDRLKRKLVESQEASLSEPSQAYEVARRQTRRDLDELWRFLHSQLTAAVKESDKTSLATKRLQRLQHSVREYYTVLRADVANVTAADGWEAWRARESHLLTDLMRRRIENLQNPADCSTARKLVCNLNKVCGFGCQLHHVVYCLMMAYGTGRTLVLNSRNWRYNRAGWEQVFQPLSNTCQQADGRSKAAWPVSATASSSHLRLRVQSPSAASCRRLQSLPVSISVSVSVSGPQLARGSACYSVRPGSADTQVLTVPIIDVVQPRPPFLPLSIPADLAPRLTRIHGDPGVWFIAQFVRFLMRPQAPLQSELDKFMRKVQLRSPCVGVHIRRTDKVGTEAAFHSIDEYMSHVETFFDLRQVERGVAESRCVYLASDDPSVFQDAVKKYPEYSFLGDPSVSKTAAVSSRYSDASLRGVISDIHALSLTDHLVCTFSSQVCRVAYELMQTRHVDAADRFTSLDDIFYYGGQSAHEQTARFAHSPPDGSQIALQPGDTLGIAGNHWDGFAKGENRRGKKVGLYPAYKARDKLRIVDFPTYPQVPLAL